MSVENFYFLEINSHLTYIEQFDPVPFNDMQTTAPPSRALKSGNIGYLVQKEAQCSETYENLSPDFQDNFFTYVADDFK